MTNLRILKKRDGSQVLQESFSKANPDGHGWVNDWRDLPIVEEPEPENELVAVLYKIRTGEPFSRSQVPDEWKRTLKEFLAHLLAHGWKGPER